MTKWVSRAVRRRVPAGTIATCPYCDDRVKFEAKRKLNQVVCNVYEKGVWKRVEHFHAHCYDEAGQPYGEPTS